MSEIKTSLVIKGPRVLIKDDEIKSVTDWGFELVEDKDLKRASQVTGTVIQMGKECFDDDEPWCNVGDRVFYSRYAGKFVEDPVTEEVFKIINHIDVIATIEAEK